MARVQAPEMILQQVQVFDQQIAPALSVTQQRLDLSECRGIDLTPLGMMRPAAPTRAGMDAPVVFCAKSHDETSAVAVIASEAKQSRPACTASARDCFVA
jgi:hypothetical protein